MFSVSRRMLALVVLSLLARTISSGSTALSVTPSTNWYGDDGTWSAVSIRVGTPPQWVDVMVSTLSSEIWVIGPGGCDNNSLCESNRGGVFDPFKSSTWHNEGLFELGADTRLGNQGYALYGLDDLTYGSTGVVQSSAIIGQVNDTGLATSFQTWLGFFGLGIVPGNFTDVASLSSISALVEKVAVIPSHSYGYTAGAKYQQKGVPNSLTLGGYDANRFVPHNVSFELNPSQQPQAYVNSISVVSASTSNNWTTPVQLVSTVDRVSAIIDSSTPYLWLPQSACNRFAESLGLTYNDSLNLYTFDRNSSQHDVLGNSQLTFTFSLSDLVGTNSINITLPYTAFDLQLTFPAIPNSTYGAADSTKYYFPLRQAANEAQYTIGRVFLQEAYLITNYERNKFYIHQAVHTADPIGNTSIVSISQYSDSNLSGAPSDTSSRKLSVGAIVGIVVGAAVFVALLSFLTFYLCKPNKQKKQVSDEEKPSDAQPRTFLDRILHRQRPRLVHEASGSTNYAQEVAADAEHERFELPAPLGPVELDSESGTLDGTTENGSSTQDSANMTAYERARRKIERQQAAATQAQSRHETYPVEKTENDVSDVAHYRGPEIPDIESPLVSPVGVDSPGFAPVSGQPSPLSQGFSSQPTTPGSPPPTYRRINPANVVYAGRLPDNVQLPAVVPRMVGRDGRTIRVEETMSTQPGSGETSLGSRYTDNEQVVSDDLSSGGSGSANAYSAVSPVSNESGSGGGSNNLNSRQTNLRDDPSTRDLLNPWGSRRRLDGEDIIHVPQPAENRFSWEEERITGNEGSL